MHERYDAVIIGGGPAGALAALLLARAGRRVAVLEKRKRHEGKTCGHCLDGRAAATLERAGLREDVQRIAVNTVSAAMVYLPATAPLRWSLTHDGGEPTLVVQRSELDQLLLDRARHAGATVVQPATARIVRASPGHCIVTAAGRSLHAPLLIGADGLRSRVAQAAGLATPRHCGRKYGFSMTASIDGDLALEQHAMHMFVVRDGYLGMVWQGDDRVHIAALVNARSRHSPTAFVSHVCDQFPQLRALGATAQREVVAAGPMPWRARAVANEFAALIGDAAGYIEPFTGEGLKWAIQSAELLVRCIEGDPASQWSRCAAMRYREQWQQSIARRQRFCRVMAWSLEKPRLLRPLIELSRRRPALAQRVAQRVLAA